MLLLLQQMQNFFNPQLIAKSAEWGYHFSCMCINRKLMRGEKPGMRGEMKDAGGERYMQNEREREWINMREAVFPGMWE